MFTLDEDALHQLLTYLAVPDLLALRQICKWINILTRNSQLWMHIYRRDATESRTSLPAHRRTLSTMSSFEVEILVLHALRLADTLYRPNTSGMNTPAAFSVTLHRRCSVTWVKFFRDQLLIVASSDAHQSSIALWSVPALLQGGKSTRPLTECYLPGPVYRGVLDLQGNSAVFAIELRSRVPSIQVVCLHCTSQSTPTFCLKASLQGAAVLRSLRGHLVGFALYNELSVPYVWDWRRDCVNQFYREPSSKGGCVAMTFCDNLAAVIEPYRLSLYTLPSDGALPEAIDIAEIMCFDDRVASATIEFSGKCAPRTECIRSGSCLCPPTVIHVAVCSPYGIHVYDVPLELGNRRYRLVHRWSSPALPTEHNGVEAVTLSPSFGHGCHSVSYITDSERLEDNLDFVTTRLPTGGNSSVGSTNGATSAKLMGADMPVLYLAATHDFGDTLGLLVVGNGFGELALYNFGAVPLPTLAGCLQRSEFVSEAGDIELSKSLPAFHPLYFIPYLGRFPYDLEHTFNYFGTPTPLIYQDTGNDIRMLFSAGGLLFILVDEPVDAFIVAPQGTTIGAAAQVLEAYYGGLPFPSPAKCVDAYCVQLEALLKWRGELEIFGKNRWAELKDRGGEVHPDWLIISRSRKAGSETYLG